MRNEVFSPKANLGIVVRGPMDRLSLFWDGFEDLCREHGLKIAFKTASGSRLWIHEDGNDKHDQEAD